MENGEAVFDKNLEPCKIVDINLAGTLGQITRRLHVRQT